MSVSTELQPVSASSGAVGRVWSELASERQCQAVAVLVRLAVRKAAPPPAGPEREDRDDD